MSFSSDIKNQLCEAEHHCPRCITAELSAMVRFAGSFKKGRLRLSGENFRVAERAAADIREAFGIDAQITGDRIWSICIEDERELENLGEELLPEYSGGDMEELLPFSCCRASFVRGAFLGGGSVSDPEKGYHMEFVCRKRESADMLQGVLESKGFSSKLTKRKGGIVVYIKECDRIADILGYMGAGKSALELYNIQAEKDMRNRVNRRVNCETANVEKVAKAAWRQLRAIDKIEKEKGLDTLSDTLFEMAKLRREFPEDSLKELGERLSPPIGKSGVNHRLNRIMEIADEI